MLYGLRLMALGVGLALHGFADEGTEGFYTATSKVLLRLFLCGSINGSARARSVNAVYEFPMKLSVYKLTMKNSVYKLIMQLSQLLRSAL